MQNKCKGRAKVLPLLLAAEKYMKLIFEDESVIVCVKPVGLLSQGEGEDCLIAKLKEHTKGEIYPIHRLDRGVGGVMVYARTKAAAASLSKQVSERGLEKEYLALIHGKPEEKSAVLEDLLFKDSRKNKVFVVKRERKGVKKALCRFEALLSGKTPTGEEYTLVRVRLRTGRTHQIRVQFASRKMPIFGDGKYGARDGEKEIALFSCAVGFMHPKTGQKLRFESYATTNVLLRKVVAQAGFDANSESDSD